MSERESAALVAWPNMEGFACVEAEKHQPDTKRGGCTCGFCVWSVEHVVVMTVREVLNEVRHIVRNPVDLSGLLAKASEPWRCEHGADTRTCEVCAAEDEAFADEHAKASEQGESRD